MLYGIIYKITNIKTGLIYIGQTTYTLNKRWTLHKRAASLDDTIYGDKSIFHTNLKEYGLDSFIAEILCSCFDKEELDKQERYIINQLNTITPNGLNSKQGGASGKWSSESKLKLSNKLKKIHKDNPEFSKKIAGSLIQWFTSLTEEEKISHIEFLSQSSKLAWNIKRKKEHSNNIKMQWNGLSEDIKVKRKSTLYRNNKEYWNNQDIRLKQTELLKKAHKTGKYKNKKPSSLTKWIRIMNINTGDIQEVFSIAKAIEISQLSRSSINKSLSKKISINGFKFETIKH